MKTLNCPLCGKYPRGLAIWQCTLGHLICGKCQPTLRQGCPTTGCSSDTFTKNYFAAYVASTDLSVEAPVECPFLKYGCSFQADKTAMTEHVTQCRLREVSCPSFHRGGCTWTGSLPLLTGHLTQKGCVHILKADQSLVHPFRSAILDFAHSSIFTMSVHTYWKPVMMISPKFSAELIHLSVARMAHGKGGWALVLRSYSPAPIRESIRARLTVYKTKKSALDKYTPVFMYSGRPIDAGCTLAEARRLGRYMSLQDDQIKSLVDGKTLFEYALQLEYDCVPNDTDGNNTDGDQGGPDNDTEKTPKRIRYEFDNVAPAGQLNLGKAVQPAAQVVATAGADAVIRNRLRLNARANGEELSTGSLIDGFNKIACQPTSNPLEQTPPLPIPGQLPTGEPTSDAASEN